MSNDISTLTAEQLRRELFSLLGGILTIGEGDRLIVQWKRKRLETSFYAKADPLDLIGIPDWPSDLGAALALCLDVCGAVEIDTVSVPDTVIIKTRRHMVGYPRQKVSMALSELALMALRGDE